MISSMQLDVIMSSYLLMTPFFSRMIEILMLQKKKQVIYLKKNTRFVHFHVKNKPIREHFDCIQTTFLTINRVKCVQYLG